MLGIKLMRVNKIGPSEHQWEYLPHMWYDEIVMDMKSNERPWHTMMTSSNGNNYRIIGHLCGEFTDPRWIPRTKASDAKLWCFLWSACVWINGWVNNREAGDLRRYRAHYDVTVISNLMHWSACIIGWKSGLLDILISPYIAQMMGRVIGRIHYDLKVVFCFRHFTVSHYHHDTRLLTGVEHM